MGAWNGVGGKIEPNETIESSMIREIKEETNIDVIPSKLFYKGTVTWNLFDAQGQGLYLFVYFLNQKYPIDVPKSINEGILDWKPISWTIDKVNQGIAKNIPYFLSHALKHEKVYNYYCIFENDLLKDVKIKEL